ncbi:translation initiation factor eIF4G KNAG_0D03190 [Huiozyma naganishii CBS 8797]|uniref:MIF4G domain-containing protein n=1 Tax=Huiozyma naganishii (strain ATCC MYA-139 / BCRC 22969 / CBS 8797 / KCTC 17520 / NBRC 10181 / NCYC 3082 / Yp74L-3) TaxID=1071383 RepID=J7R5E8_HUIN7|nr:hypothetical protein KNAG_0D03190 [Kazachstania naganishii CBS 8797]CCK70065.1 hypothetical protein KNAG_0D03190 [Kazachstania naganishii CBS 8797]
MAEQGNTEDARRHTAGGKTVPSNDTRRRPSRTADGATFQKQQYYNSNSKFAWPGYYVPQMYYVPPAGVSGELSPSPPREIRGDPPVQRRAATKIEITTKSGQKLDLKELGHHHQHQHAHREEGPVGEVTSTAASVSASESPEKSRSPEKVAALKAQEPATVPETAATTTEGSNGLSQAELNKRNFLEQVRLRKLMLDKKKGILEKPKVVPAATTEDKLGKPDTQQKANGGAHVQTVEEIVAAKRTVQEGSTNGVQNKAATPGEQTDDVGTAHTEPKEQILTNTPQNEKLKPEVQETAKILPDEQNQAENLDVQETSRIARDEGVTAKSSPDQQDQVEEHEVQETAKISPEQQETTKNPSDEQDQEEKLEPKENTMISPDEQKTSRTPPDEQNGVYEKLDTANTANPAEQKPVQDDAGEKSEQTVPSTDESGTVNVKKVAFEKTVDEQETSASNENKLASFNVTQFLDKLNSTPKIEDIFKFPYPSTVVQPETRYKLDHIKYAYGPLFLLQFKEPIRKIRADSEWLRDAQQKIVITPAMKKSSSNRQGGGGGGGGGGSSNRNSGFGSRSASRKFDDRKSGRTSYTPRRERMENATLGRNSMRQREPPKPVEPVAPLVPSANRWVPKFKAQKSEKKLAPDGVTELLDQEEITRKMKSLLNKLTLEKFDPISKDILAIADQSQWETNGESLRNVIEQIYLKACDESYWSSMYAQLCGKIVKDLSPEMSDENFPAKTGPKLVLHYLVVRCHEEFEKGWTDKLPTNPDGSPLEPEMMSDEYYAAMAAKRRGLGLLRFIGYLYRLNLLTGKMMFECFRRLMKDLNDIPSEDILESVVELLTTVGKQFEHDSFSTGRGSLSGSVLFDKLFQQLQAVIDEGKISSRIKFKIIDVMELRDDKNWHSEKANQGPKTIKQIHDEEEKIRASKENSRGGSRRGGSGFGSKHGGSRRDNFGSGKRDFSSRDSNPSSFHSSKNPFQSNNKPPRGRSANNMFDALRGAGDN